MSSIFPSKSLTFPALLNALGPDIDSDESEFAAERQLEVQRDLSRAESIYLGETDEKCPHALMWRFIDCFREEKQSRLFGPLIDEWRCKRWTDVGVGAYLRAAIKTGSHTSNLLDIIELDSLMGIISSLPLECLHTPEELVDHEQLPDRITIHRGGWAEASQDLVNRSVSWTLDFDTAEHFVALNVASFWPGQRPYHLSAEIDKKEVTIFYRHENEVIVHPTSVLHWEELQTREVIRRQPFADEYSRSPAFPKPRLANDIPA